ncbi:dipeptide epimerase [Luteimonas sp. XNQY3]|nr:dipeptide epimerase [Luteimonas sp. XNQY3]MCD9007900.1 dipeptide epimerase [Luteimonas sp. XNQY3]
MSRRQLQVRSHAWPLKEPFVIARSVRSEAAVVIVEITDGAAVGRGEAGGIAYRGETPASMTAQIESVRAQIEARCAREDLRTLLPAGGARHAVDAALWDLEAKQSGLPVWRLAGAAHWRPVDSAVTIGIRPPAACEQAARERAAFPWIKLKVDRDNPVEAVAAVRRGAPQARLIVDANQAWTIAELRRHARGLRPYRVDLLEQPLPADADAGLTPEDADGIALCADESLSTVEDLPRLAGRYRYVNIKLDKVGGLSAGLELAAAAKAQGFELMVGCMLGGSVSVAPAIVLAQQCAVCDLDAPWLQSADWPEAIVFRQGHMHLPVPALWG